MLSYQHAYHAGNPADLHKHIVYTQLITMLMAKPRGLTFLETHAGRGLYDLNAPEAQKTGEAREGIERLRVDPETEYGRILAKVRSKQGASAYPGSPYLAAEKLRGGDRLILMEKHPAEVHALKKAMKGYRAEIHHRDGYEGVLALCPPVPRRGLVLVDPSYEVKTEYGQVVEFTHALHRKWPEGCILIWYPLLPAKSHEAMVNAVESLPHLRHEVGFSLKGGKGMTGSGLLLINPPYLSHAAFDAAILQTDGLLKLRVTK
ncbi:MAG: 23S rRNA (adenine(2030)-N(6))-methyltransferase RlmJ [Pseudomonadota bacterium]